MADLNRRGHPTHQLDLLPQLVQYRRYARQRCVRELACNQRVHGDPPARLVEPLNVIRHQAVLQPLQMIQAEALGQSNRVSELLRRRAVLVRQSWGQVVIDKGYNPSVARGHAQDPCAIPGSNYKSQRLPRRPSMAAMGREARIP